MAVDASWLENAVLSDSEYFMSSGGEVVARGRLCRQSSAVEVEPIDDVDDEPELDLEPDVIEVEAETQAPTKEQTTVQDNAEATQLKTLLEGLTRGLEVFGRKLESFENQNKTMQESFEQRLSALEDRVRAQPSPAPQSGAPHSSSLEQRLSALEERQPGPARSAEVAPQSSSQATTVQATGPHTVAAGVAPQTAPQPTAPPEATNAELLSAVVSLVGQVGVLNKRLDLTESAARDDRAGDGDSREARERTGDSREARERTGDSREARERAARLEQLRELKELRATLKNRKRSPSPAWIDDIEATILGLDEMINGGGGSS